MSMRDPAPDPARGRFLAIQACRLGGTALALAGLLTIYHRTGWPIEAGYALFLIGIAIALLLPSILIRRWKSPPA